MRSCKRSEVFNPASWQSTTRSPVEACTAKSTPEVAADAASVRRALGDARAAVERSTPETYGTLQLAFDRFKNELVDGRLTPVVFVFLRKTGMCGAFRPAA